jgi:hypothetical protein
LPNSPDKIYASAPSEIDDDLWLEEGKRMVTESLALIRDAANALTKGLGMLHGLYLAILGFGKPSMPSLPIWQQALFILPMLLWLGSLYLCLHIAMTRKLTVFLNSPSDIREKVTHMLVQKQTQLQWAFWLLAIGLLATFTLFFWRWQQG